LTNPQSENFIEPEVVVVTDPEEDAQAINEAVDAQIPVVAIADSGNALDNVDLVIPANNKAENALGMAYYLLGKQFIEQKDGEFETAVYLVLEEDCNVRSEALEAGRIAASSHLAKVLEPEEDFILRIKPYPHHVLRYHPLAGIAQADRYYEGMRKPFGRPIGRAALVDTHQKVYRIDVDEGDIQVARKALERATHKMPVKCRVKIDRDR
ncbi:MAG: hypothetical protein BRC26_00870, partial [Nanohaloarchaea archaeon QH_8_44_6]